MKNGEVALLGLVEAARRIGVCVSTVKDWTNEGRIPCLRDSAHRRLFFPADIEAFALKRKAEKLRSWRKAA